MGNDEEKGFEVVDKRARREEPSKEPTDEAAAPEQPSEGQAPAADEAEAGAAVEGAEREEEGVGQADVYSLIQWIILMLSESAWQWMGLHMNPATKKLDKDLAQAKIAIDSVVYLTDRIAPHVSEEQRKAYRSLVSDLQVNFVQQSRAG